MESAARGGNNEKKWSEPLANKRVGLFVTCLVDLMRPRIGFAALKLLETAGCEVIVPETQTCCGQPAWNSGDAPGAVALAKKTIAEFEGFDYVVAPSGSCGDHIRGGRHVQHVPNQGPRFLQQRLVEGGLLEPARRQLQHKR